jgi:5-methylcytosine-specific restriction endonuclease McrA
MVAKVLEHSTLVLNRNWQPVNVATVARALTLLWNESARVVDPADYRLYTWADWAKLRPDEGERFIQAVRLRLRVPEVIVLAEYDRLPTAAVSFSRRNVFKRDHWACQYCGGQPGGEDLTIDHVLPRSQGGTSTWQNCVLACIGCNKRKTDRTPHQAGMRLHKVPVRPTWKPIYARDSVRIESWSKFISETYWNVPLEK